MATRAVIAGGSVVALEAALALRALAEDRVSVELLAPELQLVSTTRRRRAVRPRRGEAQAGAFGAPFVISPALDRVRLPPVQALHADSHPTSIARVTRDCPPPDPSARP